MGNIKNAEYLQQCSSSKAKNMRLRDSLLSRMATTTILYQLIQCWCPIMCHVHKDIVKYIDYSGRSKALKLLSEMEYGNMFHMATTTTNTNTFIIIHTFLQVNDTTVIPMSSSSGEITGGAVLKDPFTFTY